MGLKKKGVLPEKHGIAYLEGTKPMQLEGEPKLGFPPVRIKLHAEGETLHSASRINYSKLYTVEHNVKVFILGAVNLSDWHLVPNAVDACWRKKNLGKRPKS